MKVIMPMCSSRQLVCLRSVVWRKGAGLPRWLASSMQTQCVLPSDNTPSRSFAVKATVKESDTSIPYFLNFYDKTINSTATKDVPPLIASDLLVLASVSNPVERSTDILNQQLPPYVARVLLLFHKLPFIVGCNPHLKKVHTMYATAFKSFFTFAHQHRTTKKKDEFVKNYTNFLRTLLEPNAEVLALVSRGLSECVNMRYMAVEDANIFMKELIQSRIHIRFLMENHIDLLHKRENHVGRIHTSLSPAEVAKRSVVDASEAVNRRFGKVPYVVFDGETNFRITFVEQHLEFILTELLKNAMTATVERYRGGVLPPIRLTVAHKDTYFVVRISDQGTSFNPKDMHNIMRYSFEQGVDNTVFVPRDENATFREQDFQASAKKEDPKTDAAHSYAPYNVSHEFASRTLLGLEEESEDDRLLHNVGVGLPLSHAYARYFDGDVMLVPMPGLGVDAFVTMYCLASQTDTVIDS
eukprot:m.31207 g.31207  ORF g.31207 m.31207 type:complete len:469 (-) comp6293_c0_seq1:94-1500(-)